MKACLNVNCVCKCRAACLKLQLVRSCDIDGNVIAQEYLAPKQISGKGMLFYIGK